MTSKGTNSSAEFSSPKKISLSLSDTPGIYHSPYGTPSNEAAQLTSSLLDRNHNKFHIYFNSSGFHNHIVHHHLSLYALNASPGQLQQAFDNNASYQRALKAADAHVVADMSAGRNNLLKYLPGDEHEISVKGEGGGFHYASFLAFWKQQIEELGVKRLLEEWVFKGDEVAEKVFGRLYAGFLHPFIHFGFALEFHQSAILAEALAQACVHENWVYPVIQAVENASSTLNDKGVKPRPLVDLLVEGRENKTLREAPHFDDGNKARDGVLARSKQEAIDLVSQWFIPTDNADADADVSWEVIEEKNAEHIHAAFLYTCAAAFHQTQTSDGKTIEHEPRLDFFYIHDTNASIFLSSFMEDPLVRDTLGKRQIIRILQVKAWLDIIMYLSRGSPEILSPHVLNKLQTYETKAKTKTKTEIEIEHDSSSTQTPWERIIDRVLNYTGDDGHMTKFIRGLANARRVCARYEDREWCVIKGDMWERMGWMAVDSIGRNPEFVRGAGWDEAWNDVPVVVPATARI